MSAQASEVLGVVCVADRLDDKPFSREDLATLRTLTAPAALALAASAHGASGRTWRAQPSRIR
jgi:GAF domain-containing protein